MSIRKLRVEFLPHGSVRPSARNPRTHDDAQLAKIVASIREFGWTRPLLVDETGEIIAGEATWRAAGLLAMPQVPAIRLADLTPAQRDAYRIADNRLALDADWNEQLLASVIRDLEVLNFDLPIMGLDDNELARLVEPIVEPSIDDVADEPPPAVPVTRLGDVWQLGEHRLVCGDSTLEATLRTAFADSDRAAAVWNHLPAELVVTDPPYGMSYEGGRSRADMVVTDPPYGMSFGKGKEAGSTKKGATVKAHGMILGDDAKGEALVDLVSGALLAARGFVRDTAAWYVCFTWRTWREFQAALDRASLPINACIVWNKGSIGLGFSHYRPQHEFIFYSAGKRWLGGNAESDVWEFTRGNTCEYVHPTQKPVALLERAIRNSSRVGDVVLDLFGGSGSTLIACERLGRQARLIELDPKYCDAIVRRWEKLTGKRAERQ